MKLWHDDVRPPPDGWKWARTNEEAKEILTNENVEEISLDHDLGYDGPPPRQCEECFGRGKVTPMYYGQVDGDELIHCMACDGDGFFGGDLMYIAGDSEENGYLLVKWMVQNDKVPPKITIHSWNHDGAEKMAQALIDAGYKCNVSPYVIRPPDTDGAQGFADGK